MRRYEKMHVVRHQDVRVNRCSKSLTGVEQPIKKRAIVGISAKSHAAVVPALNYMLRLTWENESSLSCHDAYFAN